MRKNILALAATVTLAVAGGIAALAGVGSPTAHASTSGCLQGTFQGYCTSLTDLESPGAMSFDVFRQVAVVGNHVVGFANSDGDKATDVLVLHRGNDSSKPVFIAYAPTGVPTNLCVSEPASLGGLELRACNPGAWQSYTENPVYPVYDTSNSFKLVGYADTTLAGPFSYAASGDPVTAVPTSGSAGFILVNKATGDTITSNGLRKQFTGVAAPTNGIYSAAEVFNVNSTS